MPTKLLKDYDTSIDSRYLSQQREDLERIENGLNEIEDTVLFHKNAKIAHTSDQIDHGGLSVSNRLNNLWARFTNLIVNHDGTDVKEVVDSRVGTGAKVYDTLKDRLDAEHSAIIKDLNSRYLNVLNYMIAGETDASLFVQRALDDAYRMGGAQVYIPASSIPYTLKQTLVIKSNTTLSVNENAVLDRQHDGDFIINFEKVKGNTRLTGYNGYSNIVIEGGTWKANGDIYKSGQAIIFAHARNVIARDLTIYDVCGGHAVEVNGIDGGLIEKVNAFGFEGQYYRGAFQIDLDKDGSPPTLGWYGSFDGTPCKNITVKNCKVGKSDKMGAWGRAVESHSSFIGVSHQNINVIDNIVHGTLDVAIRAYAWDDVYIARNKITECGAGIVVNAILTGKSEDTVDINGKQTNGSQKQSNVIIEENTIDTTTMKEGLLGGIAIWGQGKGGTLLNVTLTDNTVKNTPANANAIYVKQAETLKIDKNTIEKSGQNGISVSCAKRGSITKNIITNTAITGIYVASSESNSDALRINDNTVDTAGGHGIHLDKGTTRSQVHNNNIYKVGQKEVKRYNGIYVTNASNNNTVRNNNIYSHEKRLIAGVFITGSNSGVAESGNFVPNSGYYYQDQVVNQSK
ncbi:right-handed parallel beta-helix repeat-containing protein [Bacillus siamensis]|uniref:right-handed parallel beta-helix repeat-containing protein n=1 Tax=Bacillus siamensis TaxID=659243 RepID=UPI0018E5BC7A|nr:right-handed parallel beta-helix repeat-containing protein [Bacillus siamensis]QQD82689.1 right-handed parallel beta-helix repeat-containing protein [Bacillus siamensis]